MEPMRTEQDSVHQESRKKLDALSQAKQECAYTRNLLTRYLQGHVFRFQKNRVDRHLRSCAVCSSEFDALKRAEETRLFLNDIEAAEGLTSRLKQGMTAFSRFRTILYRPLWIAAIVLAAVAVYSYLVAPRQIDTELESIVKTNPTTTASMETPRSAPQPTAAAVPAPAVIAQPVPARTAATAPAGAPEIAPLAVTLTIPQETEKIAVRRINEVMRGHGQLRKNRFSDDVREISGSLTAKELLTFFNRIEDAGRASYSRKRFDQFPGAQPIPFIMKLKVAPTPADRPASLPRQDQLPAEKPAVPAVPAVPVATAPTTSPTP